MIDNIISFNKLDRKSQENLSKEILNSNNARLLFLLLYFSEGQNIKKKNKKILDTKEYKYIYYLLRHFKIEGYQEYVNYLIGNSKTAENLYNILFDIDYLDTDTRIEIINHILDMKSEKYIYHAFYYFFNYLKLYDEKLLEKIIPYAQKNSLKITKDNYKDTLDYLLDNYDGIKEPKQYSSKCYKGRNGYVPNLIVCHSNNTYNSAIKYFYDNVSEVSSHFVIRRDGYVKEVISLDDAAWTNGTSLDENSDVYYKFSTSKIVKENKDNANYFSFTIEHESFDGSLTDKQFEATIDVMERIIQYIKDKYEYDFIIDREHIIGHCEVNPLTRTKCPGKMFPYEKIINELKK